MSAATMEKTFGHMFPVVQQAQRGLILRAVVVVLRIIKGDQVPRHKYFSSCTQVVCAVVPLAKASHKANPQSEKDMSEGMHDRKHLCKLNTMLPEVEKGL